MVVCAAVLALRLRTHVARAVWLCLLVVGIANALVLNVQPYNLIHGNLVHYFLGAKYPFPYQNLYKMVNAALEKPQIGMRDLGQPDSWVREHATEQRAYFIDMMRDEGVEFDPLASLADLSDRARQTGTLQREARRILNENLPASQIDDFKRDVRLAAAGMYGRELTRDAGFNGSPFYALVRHMDPTLYGSIGPATAYLNLAWQIVAVLVLTWVVGITLGLDVTRRLAMAALVFASWDFVSFAFPGLVFAGLYLPVAIALYAMQRLATAQAGVAIAWAGLIKLFPFILLLPAAVRLVRAGLRRLQSKKTDGLSRQWFQLIAWCVAGTGVLALAATFSGRSWLDFFYKIIAQFSSKGIAGNNVSLSRGLSSLGIDGFLLPAILSVASLATLAVMFYRSKDDGFVTALPRRSLVLFAAIGWMAHNWLNYYSVAMLLLLPLLARRHRVGAPAVAIAMAFAFTLPEFSDPQTLAIPALLRLKLAPYILVPAWLVYLEFRETGLSRRARRIALAACAVCLLIIAGEAWRMHTIRKLGGAAHAYFSRGDAKNAIDHYQRLLRLSPRNAAAYNGRAVAYFIQGDRVNAQSDFERAVRLNPEDSKVRQNHARFLLKTGSIREATHEYETAHRLMPYDESILIEFARARFGQGQKAEAISLLTRALELQPENKGIRELLKRVQKQLPSSE